jgi:hypothetical protein
VTLEPGCDVTKLENPNIYMCAHSSDLQIDDLTGNCELIPPSQWTLSLRDIGIREGFILFFTSKNFKKSAIPIKRDLSHGRKEV